MNRTEYSLADYPAEELYRVVADSEKVIAEKGWVKYEEREPGCIQAFFKALLFATQYLDNNAPLSLVHFRIFNRLLGDKVKKPGDNPHNPPGKFYTKEFDDWLMDIANTHSFNISNISLQGLKAFIHGSTVFMKMTLAV